MTIDENVLYKDKEKINFGLQSKWMLSLSCKKTYPVML